MTNKVALIVGPGHAGLGEALANRYGQKGYTIALLGRNPDPLNDLVKTLTASNISAFSVTADLASPASVSNALKEIAQKGDLQVVLYTATMRTKNKPADLTSDLLTESLASNLLGAVTVTNLALPYVKKTGDGVFLYTGSIVAAKPGTSDVEQSIGKAGLHSYVIALNKELSKSGIFAGIVTINTYIRKGKPGHMDPNVIAKAFEDLGNDKKAAEVQYH